MLRLSSCAALLAVLLFSGTAAAQTLAPEGAPAPRHRTAPPSPVDNLTPGCAPNGFFATATTATAAGITTATGFNYGQSFTATCTGLLHSIYTVVQPPTGLAGTPYSGILYLYAGAGTGGTLLSATPFTQTNPASAAWQGVTMADAVPITNGQVYTFFIKMTAGSTAQWYNDGGNIYGAGQAYRSANATPATAAAVTGRDLIFEFDFAPVTTSSTPTVYDGAGWRLLSTPVYGVTVDDLAEKNLVQGVQAGVDATLYPAQYPTFQPNILTDYSGSGTSAGFTAPSSTGELMAPGLGFFWYWYDQAFGPYADGTSQSRELTGFALSDSGFDLAHALVAPGNWSVGFTAATDNTYMLGNPFPDPFALSGLTSSTGTFQAGTAMTYDPQIANYRFLTLATDVVSVWQGFFVQLAGATGNPTFTYAAAGRTPTATPPFYGRTEAVAAVPFELHGTTEGGTPVHDVTATVRFLADALVGWDAQDLSKMIPPSSGASAFIAPMGERDGTPERLAINALPSDLTAPLAVPVAFTTSEAGTFTITWPGATLPTGWSALLTDAATGASVDLATTADYAFAAAAGDWSERFSLVITPAGVTANEPVATGAFRLGNVAPNPTAGAASLALRVGTAQDVRATVYDALGRQVAVAFDGPATPAADVVIALDAARLAPGAYVVRVEGQTFSEARRVTVVR